MRFYLTENSELVPFTGKPYLYEERTEGIVVDPVDLYRMHTDALLYLDHPNMLYLHPNCQGIFDRSRNNPYLLSVGTFTNAGDVLRKLGGMTHIFRRLDLRQGSASSLWLDYLRDRHNRLQPVIRKAIITEFLDDNI